MERRGTATAAAARVFHSHCISYFSLFLCIWCFHHETLVASDAHIFSPQSSTLLFLAGLAVGTVTHLDLSWNDLGVEGGKAILDGMQAWSQQCVTGGKMTWVGIRLLSSSQYMYICCLIYLDHLDTLGALANSPRK